MGVVCVRAMEEEEEENIQRSDKKWSLGCVNPASWFTLAAGGKFTRPRVNLLADPSMRTQCTELDD